VTDYAAAPALLAAAQETIRQLADENAALLAANTRLRGERDRARDLAVRSGIFEDDPPRSRTGFKIYIDGQRHCTCLPKCCYCSDSHDGGES